MRGKLFNVRERNAIRSAITRYIRDQANSWPSSGKAYANQDDVNKNLLWTYHFMTDQDLDGSHIKGLAINLFESEWPASRAFQDLCVS